jgi:hypothetical protein
MEPYLLARRIGIGIGSKSHHRSVIALAVNKLSTYPVCVNRRLIWFGKELWVASGIVLVCTGLGVGLFLHAYASLARSSFRDRATAYAQAFATTAGSWMSRGQNDVAETLAGFLVIGSVIAVEVTDAEGVVVLRAGGDRDVSVGGSSTPSGASRARGVLAVDAALPSSAGRVRMEVDTSSYELGVRHAALLAIGSAALFDGGVLWLLAWALRGRRRDTLQEAKTSTDGGDGQIIVGELVIVPARCEAFYAGHPLRLTPKQFALLSVLASEPGRVFAETEILEAAWPDSPYADARDIKQYVYLLRRRLAQIRTDGREAIVTVPGFGYRLNDGR